MWNNGFNHWNMMGWDGGTWPWFMGFHGLLWILLLALIAFGLVHLVRDAAPPATRRWPPSAKSTLPAASTATNSCGAGRTSPDPAERSGPNPVTRRRRPAGSGFRG